MPDCHRQSVGFLFRRTCLLFVLTVLLIVPTRSIAHEASSADSLMTHGGQAFERGAFAEALAHWKQAADLYKAAGNKPAQVEALVLSAQASMGLGQSKQALQSLELAPNFEKGQELLLRLRGSGGAAGDGRAPERSTNHGGTDQ